MKSKTRELAERAGFMLWEDEPWRPLGAEVDWSANYDVELQRLVELIVEECVATIVEVEHTPPGFIMPKNSNVLRYTLYEKFEMEK
jgi:hypothetical protein